MSIKTQIKRTKKTVYYFEKQYLNRKKMSSEVFVFEAGNLFIKSEFVGDNIKLLILSGTMYYILKNISESTLKS